MGVRGSREHEFEARLFELKRVLGAMKLYITNRIHVHLQFHDQRLINFVNEFVRIVLKDGLLFERLKRDVSTRCTLH